MDSSDYFKNTNSVLIYGTHTKQWMYTNSFANVLLLFKRKLSVNQILGRDLLVHAWILPYWLKSIFDWKWILTTRARPNRWEMVPEFHSRMGFDLCCTNENCLVDAAYLRGVFRGSEMSECVFSWRKCQYEIESHAIFSHWWEWCALPADLHQRTCCVLVASTLLRKDSLKASPVTVEMTFRDKIRLVRGHSMPHSRRSFLQSNVRSLVACPKNKKLSWAWHNIATRNQSACTTSALQGQILLDDEPVANNQSRMLSSYHNRASACCTSTALDVKIFDTANRKH